MTGVPPSAVASTPQGSDQRWLTTVWLSDSVVM